jgi:hypothetical protein
MCLLLSCERVGLNERAQRKVLFLGWEREGRGNIPSLDLYFPAVARNHLSLGWSRSNSHYRSSRISDTRSEGSERQGRKAASPPLVSACTSTVSPRLVPFIHLKMQTDCGKAFTLTENRAPLGQGSRRSPPACGKDALELPPDTGAKPLKPLDRGSAQP